MTTDTPAPAEALSNYKRSMSGTSFNLDLQDALDMAYQAVGCVETEEVGWGPDADRAMATLGAAYVAALDRAEAAEALAGVLAKALGGKLYLHRKTGGVYCEIKRRVAYAPLYAKDVVFVEPETGCDQALVTDSVQMGEEMVFYKNIRTGDFYARPARMFDEPTRFTALASVEEASHE